MSEADDHIPKPADIDGQRLNGEPATPEQLDILKGRVDDFLETAPVILEEYHVVRAENIGAVCFEYVVEADLDGLSEDDEDPETRTVRIYVEDRDGNTLLADVLPEDGPETPLITGIANPELLNSILFSLLNMEGISGAERIAIEHVQDMVANLTNQQTTPPNGSKATVYQQMVELIKSRSEVGLLTRRREVYVTQGNFGTLTAADFLAMPTDNGQESHEQADTFNMARPVLEVTLTKPGQPYGTQVTLTVFEGEEQWHSNTDDFEVPDDSDTEHANEILFSCDDRPGKDDVKEMLQALAAATAQPTE